MGRKSKVIWLGMGGQYRSRMTDPVLGVKLIIVTGRVSGDSILFANLRSNKKAKDMPKLFKTKPSFVTKLVFLNDATPDHFYFKVVFRKKRDADGKKTIEFIRITTLEACEMIEAGRKYFKKYLV